jgi:hypothetical protein
MVAYGPALSFGLAANVTGAGSTTGWEDLSSQVGYPGLPIVQVELEWPHGLGLNGITTAPRLEPADARHGARLPPSRSAD